MQKYNINNLDEFIALWQSNEKYFAMLQLMAKLSRLFSESSTPYLDYRLTENLFCKYFSAQNDARSCTAYDAVLSKLGIGIKTFILKGTNAMTSVEKIAEFNKNRKDILPLIGIDLARKIAEFRNERIDLANRAHGVTESQYHIIGRTDGLLRIFNTPYETINIDDITIDKDDVTSCIFHDDKNEYIFNKSKSVLLKRFTVPKTYKDITVNIIEEPLALLEKLLNSDSPIIRQSAKLKRGIDYIVLPLYSEKKGIRYVPEKSGLNMFNAGGRKRNRFEVYIPVPIEIHKNYPKFFPSRDESFCLHLPDGTSLSAKICQDNGKALMSNPNKDLGKWLIDTILKKRDWEIVTIEDLDRYGFDSICIRDLHRTNENGEKEYSLSLSEVDNNYARFKTEYNID